MRNKTPRNWTLRINLERNHRIFNSEGILYLDLAMRANQV